MTSTPTIPNLEGIVDSLVEKEGKSNHLCNQVLLQMLSALDYLTFNKLSVP
jgi:hypothetical protein